MLDQFIGQVLAEKYRIDSVLRETEFGKIYHGTHLLMDKRVTVKILSPALAVDESIVKQFSAEARNISNISHPNILNVTDFGSDTNGTVFIVFDDAEGETLKEKFKQKEEFTVDRAVNIVKQIAAALSATHLKGTFHRALNSENILINAVDSVKVLDLGVSRNAEMQDNETFSDKIHYLSPEQCADSTEADERSDIYSLGVIFYEMLAGEVPFKAENTSDLMLKHAQEPPPPLSTFRQDLPAGIESVILKMLAKNPEMRQQTAGELIDELNSVNNGTDENKKTATAVAGSPNNIWKTAFVVLAGISLLSISMIWATSSKQTDPTTLQADANSMPVQPINPATGMNESGLSNIVQMQTTDFSNSNVALVAPDTLGGGGGQNWNPKDWGQGNPVPMQVQPGGNYVTQQGCDPNNPFMSCDQSVTLVYQNQPTNVNANVKPQPSPKTTKSPEPNVSPTPQVTQTPKTTPTPEVKPTEKPVDKTPVKTPDKPAKEKTPPASTKKIESGKTSDG